MRMVYFIGAFQERREERSKMEKKYGMCRDYEIYTVNGTTALELYWDNIARVVRVMRVCAISSER